MTNVVEVSNLTKRYGGKAALSGVDLSLTRGRITGLCGPNGSGKTTLMQIIAGLAVSSSGSVSVCGKVPGKATRGKVAYMPDNPNIYGRMTVEETLGFYSEFFQDFRREKARAMVKDFGLSHMFKVSNMSKGEVEKLQLALTLSRDSELYLLDEPLSGIDKVARTQIIDLIIDNCHEGASMLISTHIIGEMERIFEEVVFLKGGQVVLQGDSECLRDQYAMSIESLYVKVCKNGD